MTELMQASNQWATRPDDERFTSLVAMLAHFEDVKKRSRSLVMPTNALTVIAPDNDRIQIAGPNGRGCEFTNHSFGQLCTLVGAPAEYMRKLPTALVRDNLNHGLQVARSEKDLGILLTANGNVQARAFTGPNYGRIWNSDILGHMVQRFGDGVTGDWKVPGEFGVALREVTKENTTLFAGDRDMFVFLADEEHRIEVPNRRDGKTGSLARGFFVWNSEVGSKTFGIGTFLFDYVCCNRIVWGATGYKEMTIRHTSGAPERFVEEVAPQLIEYQNASSGVERLRITNAMEDALPDPLEFMGKRFGPRVATQMIELHKQEEDRPVVSRWDAVTAATAYARSIPFQDARLTIEMKAGEIL